mmetsp:Transcript_19967/g.36982  ORF Transcript_19967/g.36982 Transcript_19967/m.36982 type:complete len:348 (+) Transcript_19967:5489-6532(+)
MSISHKLFGFSLLFLVVCLWVGSSCSIQLLFTEGNFQKPFFLTYFSTSMFTLYLLLLPYKRPSKEDVTLLVKTAAQFCPLWFSANYLFNLALSMSSLSSVTIISSSSSVLTLVAAVIFLKETPDILKFVATLLALAGVAMIAVYDEGSNDESIIGDIFGFGSAIAYASYCTFLKVKTEPLDMPLFFGFVGVCNIVCFIPGFAILHYTGFEELAWPQGIDWGILCINGFFGTVVSDVLWALSVRYLNTPVCTVGLTLTIPLSFFMQSMLFTFKLALMNGFGAASVILGFLLMASFEHPKISQYVSNEGLKSILSSKVHKETSVGDESFISNTTYDNETPYSSVHEINC